MTIPVICDRCRVAGTAGTGDFSQYGDLLQFDPVPVKPRVNGWDPDVQRAFIALLATTGSRRQAAMGVGRNAYGVDQLLKHPDSGSFRIAYDRAMALAKQNGAMKLATGVADAVAKNAQKDLPSRRRGHDPDEDEGDGEGDVEAKLAIVENLFWKWMGKVEAERTARLDGQVVAADFYLRQVTTFEIMFDLLAESAGLDPWELLYQLRRDGNGPIQIAATPFSQMLDDKRREIWAKMAEPNRPEHPPARFLVPKLNFSLASEHQALTEEEKELSPRDQQSVIRSKYAEDAEAQLAWEAKARQDYDDSRASDAAA